MSTLSRLNGNQLSMPEACVDFLSNLDCASTFGCLGLGGGESSLLRTFIFFSSLVIIFSTFLFARLAAGFFFASTLLLDSFRLVAWILFASTCFFLSLSSVRSHLWLISLVLPSSCQFQWFQWHNLATIWLVHPGGSHTVAIDFQIGCRQV